MVLFKRKPLTYLLPPRIDDDDQECWVIPQTGELFTTYESYLQRLDFYRQRRFIDEVTGRSGLSFFDALKSEQAGSREVDEAFPDALREPVLRRVQFSTTSRIDSLVDEVYDDFKNDFYPGEMVTVILDDSTRLNGRVRDKARFAEIRDVEGNIARKASSRYFVQLTDRPDEEALVDDNHLVRDRKVFTKQMLRSFIKNTVTREAWNGAPWLVKPRLAEEYRIDMHVPLHLQYGHKIAEKKAQKKADQEGVFAVWQSNKLPELKPAPKGKKSASSQATQDVQQQNQYAEYQRALHADPSFSSYSWWRRTPPVGYGDFLSGCSQLPVVHGIGLSPPPQQQEISIPLMPPPPIKYPIDDLDVEPVRDGTHRPALKLIGKPKRHEKLREKSSLPHLESKTMGCILEIWNTLNVYCQELVLDSFTFDDFLDAIQFPSDEMECELFVETHCAVLKKLVDSEMDGGTIQISLPDLPDSEEEDEAEEEGRPPTPTPEPEYPAKRTRSSLNKVQFAEVENGAPKSENGETTLHRAAEMFEDYGWIDRLRKRDFRNGGWQLVMVGLLHQLAGRPRLAEICNGILKHLAPLDAQPSIETARLQYSTMDINLRAQALQIVCQVFLETKTVKNFLEEMSNTMTQLRKIKIEHQRIRKEAIAKLKNLHVERRLLAPEEKSPSPMPELDDTIDVDKVDDGENSIYDSEDDDRVPARSLRRGADRAAERKRKREEEKDRRDKAAEAKQTKGSKEYQKVLKQIDKERDRIEEAEEQILIIDGDLREADCPRTRVLGKDRFCNRYWWFERNAMPYGGLPDSSTADSGYANGRLWVQGPDDMEREGFIEPSEQDKAHYYRRFQMTPIERKRKEEGSTSLDTAYQWGYYDTADELDMLIGWLDTRGVRELKLKKELNMQRDVIIKHMEARHAYLEGPQQQEENTTRMSTRTKMYAHNNSHRCLRWENTGALATLGHKHVEPPLKPRARGKKNEETTHATKPISAAASALNRQGKPVTRQGVRYSF